MDKEELQAQISREKEGLRCVLTALRIAEKKARIYARLLTEVSLAKSMEELACRFEEQKQAIETLLFEKKKSENSEGGAEK